MQALKPRPSELVQKTSPRTTKGSPIASDSQDSKPSKVLERKPSIKAMSQPEKRNMRAPEMQLHEELKRTKEELAEANKDKKRVELLVIEANKAKESERKMLESLVSQTKQLEQTMISLEEAKLEIRSLQDSITGVEKKNPEKNGSREEIRVLKNELKLAMEAEEKSKNAMDDLAIALKEVTTEANQAKGQLLSTQSELQIARDEAESLKVMLKTTKEKFREAMEESSQMKLELEESMAAWAAKENGFINCMKASEEEISRASQENDRLIDSQRLSREDNSKLRDILKQAVNEATVVKETLEIVRKENSQLKDLLSEKENALQMIKQDYECLQVSEAAALDSVRELKGLLAATSSVGSSNSENPRVQIGRRHSVGGDGKFQWEKTPEQKTRVVQSVSNVTDSLVASSLFSDYGGSMNFDDFDHIDRSQMAGVEHDHGYGTKKKKKPMLRRFGDMLKRGSFHK